MNLLLVNPNSKKTYGSLANKYSAVEPPTWALLLAESCRSKGHNVEILDANALDMSPQDLGHTIWNKYPYYLVCFVVYGQNVNAGTVNMSGASAAAKEVKRYSMDGRSPITCLIGSHVQALPFDTMEKEKDFDFAFTNEGVYALHEVLLKWNVIYQFPRDHNLFIVRGPATLDFRGIKGVIWRDKSNNLVIEDPSPVVPQERMDKDLPGYAWDLLPYENTPLDLYRAPMWHAEYDEEKRSPYAAIQTSLGCQFKCEFCMINILNRDDNDPIGVAGNYSLMRYWSPEFIIKEFDKLAALGVNTIKITDEMFLLNKKYYEPLCELLSERFPSHDQYLRQAT